MSNNQEKIENPSTMMKLLDWTYEKVIDGIPGFDTAQELGDSYLDQGGTLEQKINSLIRWQNTKTGTSGFVTGLGGIITLPVAIPANVSSVLFIQIRMIAAIAHMCGHDVNNDRVKTLVYVSLCGSSAKDILKQAWIQFGVKMSQSMINKYLTREVIKAINKAVGFRLITKNGTTGIINVGKMVPVLGGIIGATFDATTTNIIGNTARNIFLNTIAVERN